MIDTVRRGKEAAEEHSEEVQLRIAKAIGPVIENAECVAIVDTPTHRRFLTNPSRRQAAKAAWSDGTTGDLTVLLGAGRDTDPEDPCARSGCEGHGH